MIYNAGVTSPSGLENRRHGGTGCPPHWGGLVLFLVRAHLARAALCAISRLCSGESAAALASPPFFAPNFDNATA